MLECLCTPTPTNFMFNCIYKQVTKQERMKLSSELKVTHISIRDNHEVIHQRSFSNILNETSIKHREIKQ